MGIPIECIVEPRELPKNWKCPVCLDVILECVEISCGHMFCLQCLAEWLKKYKNCPMCRYELTGLRFTKMSPELLREICNDALYQELTPGTLFREDIYNLRVLCLSEKCPKKLTVASFSKHVERCPKIHVEDSEIFSKFLDYLTSVRLKKLGIIFPAFIQHDTTKPHWQIVCPPAPQLPHTPKYPGLSKFFRFMEHALHSTENPIVV